MKFNSIPKPIITREHGSWAVLFVPMIVGGVYANVFSWNVLLLAFSALGVFLSYVPVHTILYELAGISQGQKKLAAAIFWSVAYFAVGVLFILPLFAQGFWLLLFIGIQQTSELGHNHLKTVSFPFFLTGQRSTPILGN